MLPNRPSTQIVGAKTSGDQFFTDNYQMVSYVDLNGSSFPLNTDPNAIPKIKVEDTSYQTNCATMHWQRNDCFQGNQFMANNNVYTSLDSRPQTNSYSEAMPSTAMSPGVSASNLVYTDLSNQYPATTNSYQLLYTSNSCQTMAAMPKQNGCLNGEQSYHNLSEGAESLLSSCDMSPMSGIECQSPAGLSNTQNMGAAGEPKSDCVQTMTPTVLNALNDESNLKNIQFMKTIEFLRATDLLNLTLQTAELIKKNLEIQKEINNTKQLLSRFVTT